MEIVECVYCSADDWEEMSTWTDAGEFEHFQCRSCGAQSPFETSKENARAALAEGYIRNVYEVARDLAAAKEKP